MMTGNQRYWLNHHIKKFCPLDKFNLDIDTSLSYTENKRIITEQLKPFLSSQEQIERGFYTAEDAKCDLELLDIQREFKPLTLKQKRVLDLLLEGYSQRKIAQEIGIARETVKKHFMAIKKKGYAIQLSYNKYHYFKVPGVLE